MNMPLYRGDDIGGLAAPGRKAASERMHLPLLGRVWEDIHKEMVERKSDDFDWRSGRLPLYVYYSDEELLAVSRDAYNLYFGENALGKKAFPSISAMESEVISIALDLFHAPNDADGSFTSGGTESILLALKSARDCFRETHAEGVKPEIVIPITAHPAFDKAAHFLGVGVVRVDVGSDLRSDARRMAEAVTDRTMLIAGSAPCYPYGVYDGLEQLSELARSRNLWFHVDACLGGFLGPFAREEGYSIPAFEFSIPGVTSISADIHKFGFAARGASVILYRSGALKDYQGFRFDNWPRGIYSTETFLGSRPAGAIASAWAVMNFLGRAGYRRLARKTMDAAERLRAALGAIPGLEVILPSDLNIVLYRSADERVDINAVAECLAPKGWFIGRTHSPEALHLALNTAHAPVIDQYAADVRDAVEQVRRSGRVGTRAEATY